MSPRRCIKNNLVSWEFNFGGQADDGFIFFVEDICYDCVFSRWDLSRYGYVFGEGYFSFFDRTVHIDVVDLFAEVCLGIYEADETVLDLKVYVCAFIDILGKGSNGLDSQILTWYWRVWCELHVFQLENVVAVFRLAVVKR